MTTKTIMVVEDEIIIGMDIRNTLKKLGYTVPPVISSGEKALEKLTEIRPDLILMDIMLKGKLDGIETGEEIRNNYHIPVVYLTAHSDISTLQRDKQTEPFVYIVKPFEERELHTTIEIALARYQAETEVRNALQKEKELNELKSRFIAMVSHEFRTPLSIILFSAALLETYSSKWTEDKKLVHLQRIQSAVKKMVSLLEDVLLIGKTEAGKQEFKPSVLNLDNLCYEIVEEMQIINDRQHEILFISSGVTEVEMDEKLLRYILGNLLSNAIKYSPPSSTIKFEVSHQPNEIIFAIEDRGIGIPLEDQKHLFKDFHRAANVGTIPGTGLGLAIVKNYVNLHGGEISFKSEVGIGTTFTVRVPISVTNIQSNSN